MKQIEEEAAAARSGTACRLRARTPFWLTIRTTGSEKLKKGPAPLFHAASDEMRQFLWNLYAEFVGKFRDAAEKLRAGQLDAVFPPGCFPPALPYVPG